MKTTTMKAAATATAGKENQNMKAAAYIVKMETAIRAADIAAERYDANSMVQDANNRLCYMSAAAAAALADLENGNKLETAAQEQKPAEDRHAAAVKRIRVRDLYSKQDGARLAHEYAAACRADAERKAAESRAAEKALLKKERALRAAAAATAAAAIGETAARVCWDLLNDSEQLDMIKNAFGYILANPSRFPISDELREKIDCADIVGNAYIGIVETLDKLDALDAEDNKRNLPLIALIVGCVRDSIRKTYRAEYKHPSKGWAKVIDSDPETGERREQWLSCYGAIYYDGMPDAETKAALIDTAAQANGKAPIPPETAYIMQETVKDALQAVCRDDIDSAIIRATVSGFGQSEIAAALNLNQSSVSRRLKAIKERGKLIPWAKDAERAEDAEKRGILETLSDFGNRFALAEKIHSAG